MLIFNLIYLLFSFKLKILFMRTLKISILVRFMKQNFFMFHETFFLLSSDLIVPQLATIK
ncbi:hypothetical protein C7B89_19680 [Lysinibacillus capsici]|nr:hypothetical protein C7B89_19680 [Lysinibacillus capsici]